MRKYWGDFWFETLDPCHRRLTPFLDSWKTLKKFNPEIPHFFLWLENQHIPKYVPHITYLERRSFDSVEWHDLLELIKLGHYDLTDNEIKKALEYYNDMTLLKISCNRRCRA